MNPPMTNPSYHHPSPNIPHPSSGGGYYPQNYSSGYYNMPQGGQRYYPQHPNMMMPSHPPSRGVPGSGGMYPPHGMPIMYNNAPPPSNYLNQYEEQLFH